MNKLILLALIILPFSHARSCEVPLGEYFQFVESHYSISVVLREKEFTLIYDYKYPGDENRAVEKYEGKWECSGSDVFFVYDLESVKGKYIAQNLLPDVYGDNKSSESLLFSGDLNDHFLSGQTFWPILFLKNTFK